MRISFTSFLFLYNYSDIFIYCFCFSIVPYNSCICNTALIFWKNLWNWVGIIFCKVRCEGSWRIRCILLLLFLDPESEERHVNVFSFLEYLFVLLFFVISFWLSWVTAEFLWWSIFLEMFFIWQIMIFYSLEEKWIVCSIYVRGQWAFVLMFFCRWIVRNFLNRIVTILLCDELMWIWLDYWSKTTDWSFF